MRSFRRLAALLALLAVTAGFTVQGFAALGMGAAAMTAAAMTAGASGQTGVCDGCPGDDGLAAMACQAICGAAYAVLPPAAPLAATGTSPADAGAGSLPANRYTDPALPPPRPIRRG